MTTTYITHEYRRAVERDKPEECGVGDYVGRDTIPDDAKMLADVAINFKRFTGGKYDGELYRIGDRIFVKGAATLARCVYNHSRRF